MKILKVIGAVVGVHALALLLIFANPGCSSRTKARPSASDTVASADTPPPAVTAPTESAPAPAITAAPPINPDQLAISVPQYAPTRPNTPEATALEAKPVEGVTSVSQYVVSGGDSLWSVAKKNHLSVAELAAANDVKVSVVLHPGQKLIIPSKTLAAPASTTTASTAGTPAVTAKTGVVTHTVKDGEALETIARKYGVKLKDLYVANNINDPNKVIRPGQVLTIPDWQTPASKPAAKGKANSSAAAPATDTMLQPAPAAPTIKLEEAPPAPK